MLILTVFHCLGHSTPYFPWGRIQNAPFLPFSLLFCRSRYLRRHRCLSSLILRGRRYQRLKPDLKLRPKYSCLIHVNPRTYKESHIPTVVQGGLKEPLPWGFEMLQYFETILPSVKSLWSSLQDEIYFICGGAAGGLGCHQTWLPSWPPSWILSRIRKQVKTDISLCLTC